MRAAFAGVPRRLSPVLPGLLLFLFALVSFSLGHAGSLNFGRAGAMGAEKTGQTLFAGNRETNRATPVIERKDPPQSLWTGDGWGLPASSGHLAVDYRAVEACLPACQISPVLPGQQRLPRGPPV